MLRLRRKLQFYLWPMAIALFSALTWTGMRDLQASEDTNTSVVHDDRIQLGIIGAKAVLQGEEYCLSYHVTDEQPLLKQLKINWGEGPDSLSGAYIYESDSGADISGVCHRYSQSGLYYWSASFHNVAGQEEITTGYVTVEPDSPPSLLVLDGPVVSEHYLTAKVHVYDDIQLSHTSFTLFAAEPNKSLDFQTLISVNVPKGVAVMPGNAWGYKTNGTAETIHWQIDISALPTGRYAIEFFTFDQINAIVKSDRYWFNKR